MFPEGKSSIAEKKVSSDNTDKVLAFGDKFDDQRLRATNNGMKILPIFDETNRYLP